MKFDIDNWKHCLAASITLSFLMAYIGTLGGNWFVFTILVWSIIGVIGLFARSMVILTD